MCVAKIYLVLCFLFYKMYAKAALYFAKERSKMFSTADNACELAGVGLEPTILRLWASRDHHLLYPAKKSQSNRRFPYGYLVTTSLQSPDKSSWLHQKRKPLLFSGKEKDRTGKLSSSTHFRLIQLPECDGRRVQGSGTDSPWRADPRLLVIPTSCSRVAENNPDWDSF